MQYRNTLSFRTLSWIIFASVIIFITASFTLDGPTKAKFKNAELNEKCFKCHGQSTYSYKNTESGSMVSKRMYTECIKNRDAFYNSNHKQFKCIDCHSESYDSFPHPGHLRMESQYSCNDCHADDPKYAKFHFEKIDEEFQQSIHVKKLGKNFTCWMCHNPHSYKINARSNENIKQTVAYDNAICLNCHADITRYQVLTTKVNPNILEKHDWLPNQELHFKNVRCIECHARFNDTLLVAHQIKPKEKAVRRCVECHSTNSILMSTLYKHTAAESRNKLGFFNGAILKNQAYVIGANRNYYLNLLSILLVAGGFIGIVIHASFRIKNRKKNV
jgi:hypothetical protein